MNTATTENRVSIFKPIEGMQEPDETTIARRATGFLELVNGFEVITREDYLLGVDEIASIKALWKRYEGERTSFTGPLNTVLDALNAKFQPHLKTLASAEAILKGKLVAFDVEEERKAAAIARENERIAQAARDKLAAEAREAERVAQAERDRLADLEADRLRTVAAEQERIQREAEEAAAAGNDAAAAAAHAAAQELQERSDADAAAAARAVDDVNQAASHEVAAIQAVQAVVVAAPPPALVKVAGISTAKTWDYEVDPENNGMARIIKCIAANPQYADLLVLDSVKTRQLVKSLGKNLNIDGLLVFEKRSMRAARGGA